jgi:hypothetical protein
MSTRIGAAAALAAVAIAGCGGSSKPQHNAVSGQPVGGTAAVAPAAQKNGARASGHRGVSEHHDSSSELISAADAICRGYRHQVGSVGKATSLSAQEHVYSDVVGAAQSALAKLRALAPPASDGPGFTLFVHQTSAAIGDFVAAQARTRSTQESVGVEAEQHDFAAFERAAHAAAAAQGAARQLGLHVCGSPGSDWL